MAHFIVSSVNGCLITICGQTIPPRDTTGARVGVYGQRCKDCEDRVKQAWVTIK